MERWENRYANGRSGGARSVEHSRMERIRSMLLILMAVALVGMVIVGSQAIAFKNQAGDTLIARMRTECNDAVNQVNTLSRYGGSDSAVLVGKIRANVHAMDVCNSLYTNYYGTPLVAQTSFTKLYNTIDSYMGKLKNGTTTMEEQTNLQLELTDLQTMLQNMK